MPEAWVDNTRSLRLIYAAVDELWGRRQACFFPPLFLNMKSVSVCGMSGQVLSSEAGKRSSPWMRISWISWKNRKQGSLLFLCNPNNPTGSCVEPSLMERILRLTARRGGSGWLWMRPSLAFSGEYGRRSMRRYYKEYGESSGAECVYRLYAMPGLRAGVWGRCESREVIRRLLIQLPAWNVSVPAQAAGLGGAEGKREVEKRRYMSLRNGNSLWQGLKRRPAWIRRIYPSMANYIFLEALPGLDRLLADRGIAVAAVRITGSCGRGITELRSAAEGKNEALLQAILRGGGSMAKNLMIQGTMSNAGKSILTAGILRVLKQDGYRVPSFKSQNMALNSLYLTREGLEMGLAQVMQAEAAGLNRMSG